MMPKYPEFASLITTSGFIKHMKAVAGGKLAGIRTNSAVGRGVFESPATSLDGTA